jgi:hypothetical protein
MEALRKSWIYAVGAAASTLLAVLAFPSQVEQVYDWFAGKYERLDAVDLPSSYPGEIWRDAAPEQFSWLSDEWCYPSLPDFHSRFRVVDGRLERQNQGDSPQPFTTQWVKTRVYLSDKGVLRLWYEDSEWPGNYVTFTPGKTAEWQENERYGKDDGSITSGRKRLVLSCARCTVSGDGMTYDCK